jgi:hypothetical protein
MKWNGVGQSPPNNPNQTTKIKKTQLLETGFATSLAAEITHDGYDVVILDLASLDDDGWQVRESYVSKAGADDYIQVTHGDGYNGWNIAEQCGYPKAARTAAIAEHLGISVERVEEMMDEINDQEHLNSTDWSMLEALQEAAKEDEDEDEDA